MAVAFSIMLVVFLVLALAVPVGIWLLTERETKDAEVLDRESAERTARRASEEAGRSSGTDRR